MKLETGNSIISVKRPPEAGKGKYLVKPFGYAPFAKLRTGRTGVKRKNGGTKGRGA